MSQYPTPEENYNAIVEEMKIQVQKLENNTTMHEEDFANILRTHAKLGKLLELYADMIWHK